MNAKDFELVAKVCEPTLSRACRRFMPLYGSSEYSISSDKYYAAVTTIEDIAEFATMATTIEEFVSKIKIELTQAKVLRDAYRSDMCFYYEQACDFEYFRTRAFILGGVLTALRNNNIG